MSSTRLLIVDDHPIVREGLRQLLERESGLSVAGAVGSAAEAMAALEKHLPDVVLLDLSLGADSGLDLLQKIHEKWARLPVLVLSMHDESGMAERVLRYGALGYIMKHEATDRLVAAIRKVSKGEVFLSEAMSSLLLKQLSGRPAPGERPAVAALSNRELEVLRLLGQGRGTREIANLLKLSVKTVETHRTKLKDKLGVRSATELVAYAGRFMSLSGAETVKGAASR